VRSWNGNFLDDLEDYPIIVISQQNISFSEPNVKVCFSPMGALTLVEELGYKKAFLTGGAGINTAFAKLHLIEEMYINFNPVIIGEGISLFSEAIELDLSLKEIKKLTSDIVQLHYIVKET
jgi:dihydrofolate reductase